MAVTNGYTTLALLRTFMGAPTNPADELMEAAINAASRSIDNYCQRRFWLDSVAVARTYTPCSLSGLDLGDDIGDSSSVVVKTDASGDGTFETTWAATDFQLLPVDAPYGTEAAPWTAIRAVGTRTFPWLANTWLTRLDRVQVTAKWGWPAVPDSVSYACRMKAARLVSRKDSPQGVAGFGEFGPVRLSRSEDADVMLLLDPYRRMPVLVA